MKKALLIGLVTLLALTTSACSNAVPAAPTVVVEPTYPRAGRLPQSESDVPRVTVGEAKAAYDSGAAIIVDVRSVESFTSMHIQGAISIPLTDIEMDPGGVKLDKERWIITYCT